MPSEINKGPAENAGVNSPSKTPDDPSKSSKTRIEPQEILPTDRVAFEKQLKFLLAYAAASDNGQKSVSNEDIGHLVDMNPSTVSLANTFFVKLGFLIRSGRGYQPAPEVLEYQLANEWDPDNAALKLAPIIEKAWFTQALKPKLQMRPIDESEAISDLAQKARVTPDYRTQIKTLINYLTVSGLVRRDGDRLSWVRKAPENVSQTANEPLKERPKDTVTQPQSSSSAPSMPTQSSKQDGINFSASISVNMAEMATWPADRIQAFFSGLAAVLAAKSGNK